MLKGANEVPGGTDLATEIAGNPSVLYVNVHNDSFGAGAVRGQLR